MPTQRVFIGMGGNQGNVRAQFASAMKAMSSNIQGLRLSPIYESVAIGPAQPNYLNAVASGTTLLSPLALLDTLQRIEHEHGRKRTVRWGPRTLDLDILLYADQTIDTERLQVPHPQMAHRNFVLAPLLDLQPKLTLPNGVSIESLLSSTGDSGLTKLGSLT